MNLQILGRPHPAPREDDMLGRMRSKDRDEVTLPSFHSHTHLPQSRIMGCLGLPLNVLLTCSWSTSALPCPAVFPAVTSTVGFHINCSVANTRNWEASVIRINHPRSLHSSRAASSSGLSTAMPGPLGYNEPGDYFFYETWLRKRHRQTREMERGRRLIRRQPSSTWTFPLKEGWAISTSCLPPHSLELILDRRPMMSPDHFHLRILKPRDCHFKKQCSNGRTG